MSPEITTEIKDQWEKE